LRDLLPRISEQAAAGIAELAISLVLHEFRFRAPAEAAVPVACAGGNYLVTVSTPGEKLAATI
jgi:hypothetical protein